MIREGRTARVAATVAMVVGLLAGCSGDDGDEKAATRYPDAPALDLRGVLALVPYGTGVVSYTHWNVLGHDESGYARLSLTSSDIRRDTSYRSTVGVGAADADWRLETSYDINGEGHDQVISQWTDGAALGRFVDRLRENGWRASQADGELLLLRSTPNEDDDWQWARADDFAIDTARGVVRQFARSDQPGRPGPRSVLDRAGVRAAVAATPPAVTGQLRSGYPVCPRYGFLDSQPELPQTFLEPWQRAIGGLGPVTASNFVVIDPAGRSGVVAVSLPSATQATAELGRRGAAHAVLARLPGTGARPEYTVDGGRRTGAVTVFGLRSATPLDGFALVEGKRLGADSCGLN